MTASASRRRSLSSPVPSSRTRTTTSRARSATAGRRSLQIASRIRRMCWGKTAAPSTFCPGWSIAHAAMPLMSCRRQSWTSSPLLPLTSRRRSTSRIIFSSGSSYSPRDPVADALLFHPDAHVLHVPLEELARTARRRRGRSRRRARSPSSTRGAPRARRGTASRRGSRRRSRPAGATRTRSSAGRATSISSRTASGERHWNCVDCAASRSTAAHLARARADAPLVDRVRVALFVELADVRRGAASARRRRGAPGGARRR